MKENPVEAGATAEEAAQIRQNKEDIEQLSQDKLDAAALPEAVSDALNQAKASGDFKGDPGYTPAKGVDYWTVRGNEHLFQNDRHCRCHPGKDRRHSPPHP